MVQSADVVVLGSGVAGLTAALAASLAGLDVIVLEHASSIGGTSARSSGTVWVPDNHYIRALGTKDDRAKAEQYLESLVGDSGRPEMWHAFLDAAPQMLEDLEARADVGFHPYMHAPDYRQDHPGAAEGGRPLEPRPFDGRELGSQFSRLAAPLPELMLFGGMMVTRGEAMKLVRAERSLGAMWLGIRLLGRFLVDRLSHKRGTRLVLGNALVARLFKGVLDRNVPVVTDVSCNHLVMRDGRISAVEANYKDKNFVIAARRGVVLAGGGFPANATWRARYLPEPVPQYTPASPDADASTLELGLEAGAVLGPNGLDNALWFPSSIAKRRDGTTAVYPHIVLDRAKPGLIAVNSAGERFANEAMSYHEFVRAMYRANNETPSIPAWLVCDRDFIRRYGLGIIRPRTPSLKKYVGSGYLREAPTIEDLAQKIGVSAENFSATIRRFNGFAELGIDEDFGKGGNLYDRSNGDVDVHPNPCIGPIAKPPYYALPIWPTPLGTSRGLSADTHARACDAQGRPVPGLYVCGNDMQSAFGGEYPGAGAQLGQAMTFAWVAAQHLANDTQNNSKDKQAAGSADLSTLKHK